MKKKLLNVALIKLSWSVYDILVFQEVENWAPLFWLLPK